MENSASIDGRKCGGIVEWWRLASASRGRDYGAADHGQGLRGIKKWTENFVMRGICDCIKSSGNRSENSAPPFTFRPLVS